MTAAPLREAVPFKDFDEKPVFNEYKALAVSNSSLNFVIDFNANQALCAFNLDSNSFKAALDGRTHKINAHDSTRWINIWRPEHQSDIIKLLAHKYEMSPRLMLSMCDRPFKPEPVSNMVPRPNRMKEMLNTTDWRLFKQQAELTAQIKAPLDVESHEMHEDSKAQAKMLDLNHYRIVNELWHFMSVDWGHRYTSVGYNALFNTKAQVETEDAEAVYGKPRGRRIWTWIILCDDNTVISINENPFPGIEKLDEGQQQQLEAVRYNMLNVFKQLSKAADATQNPIMTVQVRAGRKSSFTESHVSEADSPSLLLYYLFDDWYSTYSLVTKTDHEYRVQLDRIRIEMFKSPQLDHVHKLHSLGRQLNVLKRLYEGYTLIIERLNHGPHQGTASGRLQHKSSGSSRSAADNAKGDLMSVTYTSPEGYGVVISPAASLRFERLRDRITLYALSEIRSCLDEKDSLMAMNFNLIAIKEESYVERLTRITILLAKFTILFIPVSLMAAYFSINFSDVSYTISDFWASFAVLFFLSVLLLIVFGSVSETQEAGPIYQSLTKTTINAWRRLRGKPKKKWT